METVYPQRMANLDEAETMRDLRKIGEFLDTKFTLPFGWRIGWDGIIGMIPVLGDFATGSLSLYIILRGILLGCPPSIVLRMGANVLVDNVFDAVPVLGNIFDFVWKSNTKNIALIESYLSNPRRAVRNSRVTIFFLLMGATAFIFGMLYIAFILARALWTFIPSSY